MKLPILTLALATLVSSTVWAQATAIATRVASLQRLAQQQQLQTPALSRVAANSQALAAAETNLSINPQLKATTDSVLTTIEAVMQGNNDMVSGLNKTDRVAIAETIVALQIQVAAQNSTTGLSAQQFEQINAITNGGGLHSLTGQAGPQQKLEGENLKKFGEFASKVLAQVEGGESALDASIAAAQEMGIDLNQIAEACGQQGPRR